MHKCTGGFTLYVRILACIYAPEDYYTFCWFSHPFMNQRIAARPTIMRKGHAREGFDDCEDLVDGRFYDLGAYGNPSSMDVSGIWFGTAPGHGAKRVRKKSWDANKALCTRVGGGSVWCGVACDISSADCSREGLCSRAGRAVSKYVNSVRTISENKCSYIRYSM